MRPNTPTTMASEGDIELTVPAGVEGASLALDQEAGSVGDNDETQGRPRSKTEITVVERQRWNSRFTYVLASIGAAVGLGNIWRFPYLCYKNGGASFLFPYFTALIFLGFPLFVLEYTMGQAFQKSAVEAYASISPRLRGVMAGFFVALCCISSYYVAIIAWILIYFVNSFHSTDNLPWSGGKAESFFNVTVLEKVATVNADSGGIIPLNFGCLVICWIFVFGSICKGTKSMKWASRLAVPLAYVVLIILFVRGMSLEGAGVGMEFYLKPDFRVVFSDPTVWLEAASQIFFSLGVASSNVITYSSYNPQDWPVLKNTITIVIANCCTSLFAGAAMFAFVGHKSVTSGLPVEEVVKSAGPGFVFVVVPEALAGMPAGGFFCGIFFFMLFLLGVTSAMGLVEGAVSILRDEYYRDPNAVAVVGSSGLIGASEAAEAAARRRSIDAVSTPATSTPGSGSSATSGAVDEGAAEVSESTIKRWFHRVMSGKSGLAAVVCSLCFFWGLLFVSRAGMQWLTLFDHIVSDYVLALLGLWEFVIVGWSLGTPAFIDIVFEKTKWRPSRYWRFFWGGSGPVIMIVLILAGFIKELVTDAGSMPGWAEFVGWLIVIVPFFAFMYVFLPTKGVDNLTGWEYLKSWVTYFDQLRRRAFGRYSRPST